MLFQILSPIKYARNMNIYDDAKRADKPNLWILLLTEWVIRLAENLADVGKSNSYRYFLQNDSRFLIVNCALKNYKCVNSQLFVAESLNITKAAQKVEESITETLAYMDFPAEHWTRIRTNNVLERINREIRRRTRVVGTFPDGESALMLVCARLRHITSSVWGTKRYLNMEHLRTMEAEHEIMKIS